MVTNRAVHFRIRVDPWWWPLLFISGILPSSQCYVALEDRMVRVRLGWLETRFPRAHVVAAQRIHGDWRWSIGWHVVFVGTKALIVNGSWSSMVELRLEPPLVSRSLLVPIRCSCVRVSLEDPDAFLAALGKVGPGPEQ
jgi:hypothetical protein